jgi:class III poly(R)-hydroxyalkanoic acid synthase PhaE subunit
VIGLAQTGQPVENQRQLIDLWVEVADARFLDLFHSDRYAAVQSKLLNVGMALRGQQRELAEVWLRVNDLPTQRDLDEAHRNIYELRKEVKLLKKALQAAEQTPTPAPEPKAATTKRQPARSRRPQRQHEDT